MGKGEGRTRTLRLSPPPQRAAHSTSLFWLALTWSRGQSHNTQAWHTPKDCGSPSLTLGDQAGYTQAATARRWPHKGGRGTVTSSKGFTCLAAVTCTNIAPLAPEEDQRSPPPGKGEGQDIRGKPVAPPG